ncbi:MULTISPECIES: sugar-binding transcriptional regulator [Micrococcaceae]|uniref:sugar-binding transcriptional regulator n=1 Tax=Micrococcaceae TaxID=1268 RepID=UPI00138ECF33|nr:sugar-binding domain-containing protein [Arthrobacter sp. Soil761]
MSTQQAGVDENRLIAEVCRLHFIEELPKSEIAERMNMSRFKVADLIRYGRDRGVVRIEITDPSSSVRDLEDRLRDKYSLERVAVSAQTPTTDLNLVGAAAADLLLEELRDGSLLGIGWGASVFHVINSLQSRSRLPTVDIVQLAGGVDGVSLPLNAIGLAAEASKVFQGRLYPLHAPAFVENQATADALREEAFLKRTFHMFALIDVAVVGIGGWKAGTSSLRQASALSPSAVKRLREADVTADILMHFTDANGKVITGGPTVMGPTVEEFTGIRLRLAVAAGPEKKDAIVSGLRSGLVNALVTDSSTASALLSQN